MIRQFRYDSDRGRYLTRDCSIDPAKLAKPVGDRWTEYLGDEPYRDFEVDVTGTPPSQTATAVPVRRYIRGYGLIATEDENGNMQFIHGDLLGSTRLMTDEIGDAAARGEYLAFGQVVDLSAVVASGIAPTPGIRYGWCGSWGYQNDALADLGESWSAGPGSSGGRGGTGILPVVPIRYGWCGSWGYQNDALADLGESWSAGPVPTGGTPTLADDESELGLLHIGARYYSPEIGRWVQRDPISVSGGIPLYAYCHNSPTVIVDPTGWWGSVEIGVSGTITAFLHSQVAFRVAGAAIWLGTHPTISQIIQLSPQWTPRLVLRIPVPFPHLVPGVGDPRIVNCLITAGGAVLKGWGL